MSREEIKEYLKRVEELEVKLVDEDQETLQWLIFGYNQCARLLNETERENQQLKQIEQEHQKLNGELRNEVKQLKRKYAEVLKMLVEYSPPCEIDGFMDKNTDYCSMNCGVDEEVFKKCWDLYITQKIEKVEK